MTKAGLLMGKEPAHNASTQDMTKAGLLMGKGLIGVKAVKQCGQRGCKAGKKDTQAKDQGINLKITEMYNNYGD